MLGDIRLARPAVDESRPAVCAKCGRDFVQTRFLARVRPPGVDGWDESLVWRPRTCPPCERRAQWADQ